MTIPSRRQFLGRTAGSLLVPAFFSTSGCQKTAPSVVSGEADHTLKVVSMQAAPDGRQREIWCYNGQLPGPTLRLKEGEKVRIKVINELKVPTSVHWHGMHQPGTWRMDGVDTVSAPPIAPGAEFIYEYKPTPSGTHWYHSHVGVQYSDGLFGPLIVEDPTPIAKYDREEILMINDWFLEPSEKLLAQVVMGGMPGMKMKDGKEAMPDKKMEMKDKPDVGDVPFQSGLVNGKGRLPTDMKSPLTVLEVKPGETIRLRLINGSSTFALRFQIDGHPLTVIATDGQPIQPLTVDNLVLAVGERYDVLIEAKQGGAHWIRAATLDGKEILAVLRYPEAAGASPEAKPVQWGPRELKLEELRSRQPVAVDPKPREIPLVLGGTMMPYRWSVNDQYYPKADPIDIAKDEVIRFAFRNPTMMDHPFHLHGHSFQVLGKPGALNLTDPALKDTINIPAKGDLVIQFKANNPGRWFFHCHIEWHIATGMGRVLEVKPYA